MIVGQTGLCPSVILEVLREVSEPQFEERVCVFTFRGVDRLKVEQSNHFLRTISTALDTLLLQQKSNKVTSVDQNCICHSACVCIHFKIYAIDNNNDNTVITLFRNQTKTPENERCTVFHGPTSTLEMASI